MDLVAEETAEQQGEARAASEQLLTPSDSERMPHLTRRAFLGAAGAAAIGLGLYAGEVSRHELVTERRVIRLQHLPDVFAGMRIAQISDFHYASFTEPFYIRWVVERVNALKPDLVLLTGDFVSMAPIAKEKAEDYIAPCAALLGGLECPMRYGVLGNHDWMVNGDAVTEALRQVGIPILKNEYLPIERGGKRIWLAGLADALSRDMNIGKAVPPHALGDKEPVLLMGHEPDTLDWVAHHGVDLLVSGHTHGGQVRLPLLKPLFLPPLGERYVAGHFVRGRTQLYVNRGIGAVGLPFRFNCPSEITEFTLQAA